MYGTTTELGIAVVLAIFIQLISAGIIVMLMDELVQKGWGLGSGISLFIMAGVAQNILWSMFSPPIGLFVGQLSRLLNGQLTAAEWVFGTQSGLSITNRLHRNHSSIPHSHLPTRRPNRAPNELRRLQRLPQQIPNQTTLRQQPCRHLCKCTIRKRVLLQPTTLEPIWTTSARHKPVLPNNRRLQRHNHNYD